MTIDVYAVITCPWSYMGRAFRAVLEKKFGRWDRAEPMFEHPRPRGRAGP